MRSRCTFLALALLTTPIRGEISDWDLRLHAFIGEMNRFIAQQNAGILDRKQLKRVDAAWYAWRGHESTSNPSRR